MLRSVEGSPTLACEVDGAGPPVVFLHGIGGGRQNWARQAAAVTSSFTSFSWDARGYGDSEDYDGPLDFSDFGDDLVRLLDQFEIERAHLVGLSMGARILMDFAPRYLDRVATLTLCDCFYGFENALSPEKQVEYIELRERPLREGKTFADLAPKLIDSLVSPTANAEVRETLRQSILRLRVEPYLKTLRASVTFDQADELAKLTMPVQLIFGSEDQLTPPSIGREMTELLPNAQLAVLDGAGHLSNLEAPEAFNQALVSFLAQHRDLATFVTRSQSY
ncbi:MAG: alpha/beta fold hydrolase [Acidimicrobiales bacterium]